MTALLGLLLGLASNSLVKSALISTAGAVFSQLGQWWLQVDLGNEGSAAATATGAWLANLINKFSPYLIAWLQSKLTSSSKPLDLSSLNELGPLTDDRSDSEIPFGLLLACGLVLLSSSAAWADAPKAIINGPTTAVPGELIVLDASGSEGTPTHFTWRISPEIKGRKQIAPLDGGKRLQMASFAGRYLVTLLVSNADGNDVLTWQVDVPGNPPCPAPEPQPVQPAPVPSPQPVPPVPSPVTPTPAPTPPAPAPLNPGRFGIGQRVRQAVLSVQSPSRSAEVAQLRTTLERLHKQGSAGTITAQEFLDVMSKALKALPDSWQVVKTLYSLGIKAFVAAQTLSTVADFTDLAAEILDAIQGL